MASGIVYGLPLAILTSIYKGLTKISHSSRLGRGGGHFPIHFLYTWLAKNFDKYELDGETSSSPGIAKFSGLSRAKSFPLEGAVELICSVKGFHQHSSIINWLKETLQMMTNCQGSTLLIL